MSVFNRWQASSHRGAATFQHTANLWEPGLPAMRATGCLCSIAGKPAPTGEWQLLRSQHICRTWLASDAGDRVSVFNRWQASSHRGSGNFSAHSKSVGAWLASDAGDRVSVFNRWQASSHRGMATFQITANLWEPGLPAMRATGCLCLIAGKPAATGGMATFKITTHL